jgi:hypothetical protein
MATYKVAFFVCCSKIFTYSSRNIDFEIYNIKIYLERQQTHWRTIECFILIFGNEHLILKERLKF